MLALAMLVGLALYAAFSRGARVELSAEELAELSQNPVANLISVPFQNNTNFDYGPNGGTQNILNIQPVILGKLPLNSQIAGYYNVVRPDDGPSWQLRVQAQLMFPK